MAPESDPPTPSPKEVQSDAPPPETTGRRIWVRVGLLLLLMLGMALLFLAIGRLRRPFTEHGPSQTVGGSPAAPTSVSMTASAAPGAISGTAEPAGVTGTAVPEAVSGTAVLGPTTPTLAATPTVPHPAAKTPTLAATATASAIKPPSPTHLRVESLEPGLLRVQWDPVTSIPVLGYNLYYSITSGSHYFRLNEGQGPIKTTGSRLRGLAKNQKYYVVVTAISPGGTESDHSEELMVTP